MVSKEVLNIFWGRVFFLDSLRITRFPGFPQPILALEGRLTGRGTSPARQRGAAGGGDPAEGAMVLGGGIGDGGWGMS
jgi:hypothetical protein